MTATTNMVFSEATNKTGMFELFQDYTYTNSTSYSAYKYARDANNALADYFMLALRFQGKGQTDDTNQTDYPEIKLNLVANQFDYPLTTDASTSANQILGIERVECATESTANANAFQVLKSYDEMEDTYDQSNSIVRNRNITSVPYRYSKRANAIFLDPTPSFSATNGIRIFFSRTPTYFAGTDTTKVAGIPQPHQKYLVLKPAYAYCVINIPSRANGLLVLLQEAIKDIEEYYSGRNKDDRNIMKGKKIFYI